MDTVPTIKMEVSPKEKAIIEHYRRTRVLSEDPPPEPFSESHLPYIQRLLSLAYFAGQADALGKKQSARLADVCRLAGILME